MCKSIVARPTLLKKKFFNCTCACNVLRIAWVYMNAQCATPICRSVVTIDIRGLRDWKRPMNCTTVAR